MILLKDFDYFLNENENENLWNLLTSQDFANVKLGIGIYEGNKKEYKDKDIEGYIKMVKKIYGKSEENWGSYFTVGRVTKFPKYFELLPLKKLDCNNTNLTELPEFPYLEKLICSHSPIKKLPTYPNLKFLDCRGDIYLKELPELPALKILLCENCGLTSIPFFPFLIALKCRKNKISSLPKMPNLEILDCTENEIKTLPELPKLETFWGDPELENEFYGKKRI